MWHKRIIIMVVYQQFKLLTKTKKRKEAKMIGITLRNLKKVIKVPDKQVQVL